MVTKKNQIYFIAIIVVATVIVLFILYIKRNGLPFSKVSWSAFWEKVLWGVISSEYGNNTSCNSLSGAGCIGKRYTDVLSLDSGTVGIAHFAAGGLCRVYESMDTMYYFGMSQQDMCDNYADKYSGASNNQWWVDGMRNWVNSPGNKKVQDRIFSESRQSAVDSAIYNGWTTDRQMAIAVGVSNSFGNGGFRSIASARDWDAETILDWYGSQSTHKGRRRDLINKHFPKSKARQMELPS